MYKLNMATTFPNKQQIRISNTHTCSYFQDLEVNLERVINCVHIFISSYGTAQTLSALRAWMC